MLYYSKKANDLSEDFLERMFAVTYLPDAETQKKVFDMALEEAGVTFENAVQFREIMQDI